MLAKAGLAAGGLGLVALGQPDQAAAQRLDEMLQIVPPAGSTALQLQPSGAVPPSVSVGGALNLDNTASTGAGAVLYSNRGSDALGRLLVVNQDNPENPQHAVRIENVGTASTVSIFHDPAGGAGDSTAEAVDIVSTNPLDTTLGVRGHEEGRGTVKITHAKPANPDPDAAALSIAIEGAGTACQGIFIGNGAGDVTSGNLLNIRNGGPGTERLVLTAAGQVQLAVEGPGGGLLVGPDANLYRSAANVLATDAALKASGGVTVSATISAEGTLGSPSLPAFSFNSTLTPSGPTDLRNVEIYKSNPFINGLAGATSGVKGSIFSSFQHQLRLRAIPNGGTGAFAAVFGFYSPPITNTVGTGWTVTNYSLLRIEPPGGDGSITNLTGLDIRDLNGRGANNYSVRSLGNAVQMRHSGGVNLGSQATPDTLLHLRGNDKFHGSITMNEQSTDPAPPTPNDQARIYIKDNKLVVQWNDGVNTLYTAIPLDSAGPYPATAVVTTDTAVP